MADQWYYWHDAAILGPFSATSLANMAAVGTILPTDTVWKEGIENGVLASSVKHLFSQKQILGILEAATLPLPPEGANSDAMGEDSKKALIDASVKETPVQRWDSGTTPTTTNRRAVAGKGAVIVGQDGTTVKYRKKCTSCGHEDSSYRSVPITRGTSRVSYYCPKCRRSCAVEIHGYVG